MRAPVLLNRLLDFPPLARLLDQYAALEERDRLALNCLGVFAGVLFVWFGIWAPLTDYASASADRHVNRMELLHYMQSTEAEARAQSGVVVSERRPGQSLLTLVSRTSKSARVKPARMQPEGNDEVSVWFEKADFNLLLLWMDKLRQEGISIRQLSIDRQEVSGQVNARLVLRT